VFVTPTSAEEVCVALLTDDPRVRIEHAFERLPELEARVGGGRAITTESGAVSVLARARAVARGNVALVGDASCAIDGIAGQGLSLAFQQAVALSGAVAQGDLAAYAATHRKITSSALRMTRLLLMMASSVTLRRRVLRFFAANPEYFARIMAVHTGTAGTEELQASDLMGLGWRILWA
jgi:menaquinone-9 beta-reductase